MGNFFGSSSNNPENPAAQVAKPKPPECSRAVSKLIYVENKSPQESRIIIEEDCRDARKVVLSARDGKWETVWDILGSPDNPRKDYLINCIPETRRWGILHQAVYWRDKEVIQRLLRFQGCDVHLKAKVGMSEIGDAVGKNAIQIANDFGYDELQDILTLDENFPIEMLSTYAQIGDNVHGYEHHLLRLTLALYRDAFRSPSEVIMSDQSFHGVLFDIFIDIETSPGRWQTINQIICDSLKPVSQTSAATIGEASTKDEFYRAIINAYTVEDSWLYAYINRALRRQSVPHYTPPADDLACGPYILMYYILMMFWNELKHEDQTTYRRMNISMSDLRMYRPGTNFIWTSFTSSSLYEDCARSFPSCPADVGGWQDENYVEVVFVIDNSLPTPWNPRNIAPFAAYNEAERTYPPGAKFTVIDVKRQRNAQNSIEEYTVNLKILNL